MAHVIIHPVIPKSPRAPQKPEKVIDDLPAGRHRNLRQSVLTCVTNGRLQTWRFHLTTMIIMRQSLHVVAHSPIGQCKGGIITLCKNLMRDCHHLYYSMNHVDDEKEETN